MQIHEIKPIHKTKDKKRVGRGGKKGTYSGRGCKGQKSRAGRKMQPFMREVIKRYPKTRGYRHELKLNVMVSIGLNILENNFKEGEKITPQILVEKKIAGKISGKVPRIKILSKGEITKALTVENCLFSKSAKDKIEKAGGSIK
ncbi:MAG: uL15 family ribosomal protein [Candidatus Pacebacteria bacterium]|nr:uL15 family ribosomal protein [Candidatus Paceibacterota bacterium]